MSKTNVYRLFGFKSLNVSDLTVIAISMYNLAYPSAVLCCFIFCNFLLVFIVFMIHTLFFSWFQSLIYCLFCLQTLRLPSSSHLLSSNSFFINTHCPFLIVTVLFVFTAYAKSHFICILTFLLYYLIWINGPGMYHL